jgi:hypothetical protein
MAYFPPAYNQVDVDFTVSGYTPPAFNAVNAAYAALAFTGRYWRFVFLDNQVNTGNICAAEIQLRGTVGGADLTGSGTATDNGNIGGGYVAANAFDNSASTMWNSGYTGNNIVQYDFGSAVTIAEYTIATRNDGYLNDSPQTWRLEYSSDATNWSVAHVADGQTSWSLGQVRTFALEALGAYPAFWRLNVSASGSGALTVAEMQLRASAGGANVATLANGLASASAFSSDYYPRKAFDQNGSTFFNKQSPIPASVQMQFNVGRKVKEYAITARSDGFFTDSPKDWALEYSYDGVSWVTADTQTNQTGWTAGETRVFSMPNLWPSGVTPVVGRRPRPWQRGSSRGGSFKRP